MSDDIQQDTARTDTDAPGTTISGPTARRPLPQAWKPGESGNPAGRPPRPKAWEDVVKVLKLREKPHNWMIDRLVEIADIPKDAPVPERRVALAAVELLAAYAYGRPHQAVAVTGPDGGPVLPVIIHHSVVHRAELPPAERAALEGARVIDVEPLPAGAATEADLVSAERQDETRALERTLATAADTGDTAADSE